MVRVFGVLVMTLVSAQAFAANAPVNLTCSQNISSADGSLNLGDIDVTVNSPSSITANIVFPINLKLKKTNSDSKTYSGVMPGANGLQSVTISFTLRNDFSAAQFSLSEDVSSASPESWPYSCSIN